MNLGEITIDARVKVLRLDEKFIGTKDYMGVAFLGT